MTARQAILKLNEDLGPPELANFAVGALAPEQPKSVGAFVLADRDGEVALIRRMPIPRYPGIEKLWWLPGGGHEGEETLQETAAREFEEETGMRVTIGRFLAAHLSPERPFVAVFFRGRISGGSLSHTVDPDRITAEVRLFARDTIPYDLLWGDVDRVLLVHEGFVDRPVKRLVEKHGLLEPAGHQRETTE